MALIYVVLIIFRLRNGVHSRGTNWCGSGKMIASFSLRDRVMI